MDIGEGKMSNVVELKPAKDAAQQRAESLVVKWHADCRPMADPIDMQELEDRIAAELRAWRLHP